MSTRPLLACAASAWLAAAPVFAVDDSNRDYAFNPPYGYNAFNIDIPPGDDEVMDVAVQESDDKIILAGYTYNPELGTEPSAVVLRLTPDGAVDNGFGTFGRSIFKVSNTGTKIYSVVLQGDGKIVVGGSWQGLSGPGFVARLNPDGSMDTTFGINGVNAFDALNAANGIVDVAVYGSRVLALFDNFFASGSPDIRIMALQPNGDLDSTFIDPSGAPAGYTSINFTGWPAGMALQHDGKIVVAASDDDLALISSFAVARVRSEGGLDASFGDAGKQVISFDSCPSHAGSDNAAPTAVAVAASGRIVVGGYSQRYGPECRESSLLAVLDADGSPDTTFSDDGQHAESYFSSTPDSFETVQDLVVESSDQILLLANPSRSPYQSEIGVVRLLPNGERDRNFAVHGVGRYDLGLNRPIRAYGLAMQGNRPIVAGQLYGEASRSDFLAFRIVSDRIFADGLQPRN